MSDFHEINTKIIEFVKYLQTLINRLFKIRSIEPAIDYSGQRKEVSRLLFHALTKKICVREALLKFPAESKDPSIQSAWHALCHLEADEDIRKNDKDYADEQDDYLELIAFTLQNGEELPQNIIDSYKGYHNEALIPHAKGIQGIISKLTRFLNI